MACIDWHTQIRNMLKTGFGNGQRGKKDVHCCIVGLQLIVANLEEKSYVKWIAVEEARDNR